MLSVCVNVSPFTPQQTTVTSSVRTARSLFTTSVLQTQFLVEQFKNIRMTIFSANIPYQTAFKLVHCLAWEMTNMRVCVCVCVCMWVFVYVCMYLCVCL